MCKISTGKDRTALDLAYNLLMYGDRADRTAPAGFPHTSGALRAVQTKPTINRALDCML